jgi:hypothetical protein
MRRVFADMANPRFYNQPHAFYAGVDLHARSMFGHGNRSAWAASSPCSRRHKLDQRHCTQGTDFLKVYGNRQTPFSLHAWKRTLTSIGSVSPAARWTTALIATLPS